MDGAGSGGEFAEPRPNLFTNTAGWSVELRPHWPAVYLMYEEGTRRVEVFSESLVGPTISFGLRRDSITIWDDPPGEHTTDQDRARVVEHIRQAFAWKGWSLQVDEDSGKPGPIEWNPEPSMTTPTRAALIALAERACEASGLILPAERSVRPRPFMLGKLIGWKVGAHPPGVRGGGWVTVRITRHGKVAEVHVTPR